MKSAKILREKIEDGDQITTGIIVTYHFWTGVVDMAMKAGLDYIIIDLEHLTHDAALVAEACAIGRRNDFPVLIRPAAAEFTPIRLAMDLGPCGLLVPYVQDMSDMSIVQEAVYLKPRGRRRPGGLGNNWVSDFNYETWKEVVEDNLIILPQVESAVGLANVDQIASHPMTTAMAVGPYDLSADLGQCWNPNSNELLHAIDTIKVAAHNVQKNMWMIGDGPDLVSKGFDFVCMTEPMMFLEAKLSELNQKTKKNKSGNSADVVLP